MTEISAYSILDNMDLTAMFDELNAKFFDGFLDPPKLCWNPRLGSSAGRFIPGSRKFSAQIPPTIEIATYLREETNAVALILDTLAHEMIHYWLWVRHRPYGHSAEFLRKMKLMGVSRYNPVPRTRPYRYVYRCSTCEKEFLARKKLGPLACVSCCKRFAEGKYDARFKLYLHRTLVGVQEEVIP